MSYSEIKLLRSGYSWCNEDHCSTTDSAMPRLEDMTPVIATGGERSYKTTPPEGINGFTLTKPDGARQRRVHPTVPPPVPTYTKFSVHGLWTRDAPIFILP
ncbi:hypothetical protein [Paenibacillus vortex]|uniref:hypothetical protein n=1 Tax=Paenibacillus vortex TaxID=71995 RepID=UPI001F2AD614|nr:hypothetical protein [Paenibacillus vortex]